MNDHRDLLNASHPDSGENTDERLRRLETAIAAMQDTQLMEQRLLERVAAKLDQPGSDNSHAVVEAGKALLPGMVRAVGAQFNAATSPTAPASSHSLFSAKTWILTEIIQEVRTFFVLYFDYRYRVSTAARIIPPLALVLFLGSWLGLRTVVFGAFVGPVLDYLLNFFLVILVYKTLQREAARYRAQFASLPPI